MLVGSAFHNGTTEKHFLYIFTAFKLQLSVLFSFVPERFQTFTKIITFKNFSLLARSQSQLLHMPLPTLLLDNIVTNCKYLYAIILSSVSIRADICCSEELIHHTSCRPTDRILDTDSLNVICIKKEWK